MQPRLMQPDVKQSYRYHLKVDSFPLTSQNVLFILYYSNLLMLMLFIYLLSNDTSYTLSSCSHVSCCGPSLKQVTSCYHLL